MTSVDYSKWQPVAHLAPGDPPDQQRDLFGGYWAEAGPDSRQAPDGWSWTILWGTEGYVVTDGLAGDETAAKAAVQTWEDENSIVVEVTFEAAKTYAARLSYADLVRLAEGGSVAVPAAAELAPGTAPVTLPEPAWAGSDLSPRLWEVGEETGSDATMVTELKSAGYRE